MSAEQTGIPIPNADYTPPLYTKQPEALHRPLGLRILGSLLGAILAVTMWSGFLLVLSVIASISVTIPQAVAAAWLCIALYQSAGLAARKLI